MKTEILAGHSTMDLWDPTYKHHHLPVWVKKAIRVQLISLGRWTPGSDPENQMNRIFEQKHLEEFFDHWGSVADPYQPKFRKFISQPYGCRSKATLKAEHFATFHGLKLEVIAPGIWHPNATTFIWSKPA